MATSPCGWGRERRAPTGSPSPPTDRSGSRRPSSRCGPRRRPRTSAVPLPIFLPSRRPAGSRRRSVSRSPLPRGPGATRSRKSRRSAAFSRSLHLVCRGAGQLLYLHRQRLPDRLVAGGVPVAVSGVAQLFPVGTGEEVVSRDVGDPKRLEALLDGNAVSPVVVTPVVD